MEKIDYILLVILVGLLIYYFGFVKTYGYEISIEDKEKLDEVLTERFGLDLGDYKVVSFVYDDSMRTFSMTSKIEVDGEIVEFYYHPGGCSSGGTDCGYYMRFISNSEETDYLFQDVKENFCSKLREDYFSEPRMCNDEPYDRTEEVREKCFAGEFERSYGERKVLAIDQILNRCTSYVVIGESIR